MHNVRYSFFVTKLINRVHLIDPRKYSLSFSPADFMELTVNWNGINEKDGGNEAIRAGCH